MIVCGTTLFVLVLDLVLDDFDDDDVVVDAVVVVFIVWDAFNVVTNGCSCHKQNIDTTTIIMTTFSSFCIESKY